MRIGSLELDSPVMQAALAGYSGPPMRVLARRQGASFALHEVVLDKSITFSEKLRRRLLPDPWPEDHPLSGQVMGADPEQLAAAATLIVATGYDAVDVNFGCPVKKVLHRHRGGYLLAEPETAIAMLRAVRGAVPPSVPVTVKMRRGLDDTPASEESFFRILDAALALGYAAITVHGRTVRQAYRGASSWEFLARVKQYVGGAVPIIGSGDVFIAEDVVRMLAETGVDGVSVARGAIGNPWIFREARALLAGQPLPAPPTVAEQGAVIREHYALTARQHGEAYALRVFHKFGIKYAELHPFRWDVRKAFIEALTLEKWQAVLDTWYDPTRDWPPGRRRNGPSGLIAAGATP